MKKFSIKIILFLGLVYGLSWALDYAISRGLCQMEDYRFQSWAEIMSGKASSDVLVLGNSRGLSHYEPQTIDSICHLSAYVLGMGGYPINAELFKYRFYCEHNEKPKYIIYDVNYSIMQIIKAPHQHESEQFLPLIYDKTARKELLKMGYSWVCIYMPLIRYFGYQKDIKNGLLEFFGIRHYTFNPSFRGHRYERGAWDATELQKIDSINDVMDEQAKTIFEEYLQECKLEGIEVIMVNSPMYKGASDIMIHKHENYAYFDSLAKEYEIEYWDYTTDYPLCNDTANFCVSVHMNPSATHRFSIDLANRLNDYIRTRQINQ